MLANNENRANEFSKKKDKRNKKWLAFTKSVKIIDRKKQDKVISQVQNTERRITRNWKMQHLAVIV